MHVIGGGAGTEISHRFMSMSNVVKTTTNLSLHFMITVLSILWRVHLQTYRTVLVSLVGRQSCAGYLP